MSTVEKTYKYDHKVAAIHKARVNVKSLADESRTIRKEEERCGECYRWELQFHRRSRVRSEARYAQLALAFLRGRKYSQVEASSVRAGLPEVASLVAKIARFGLRTDGVAKWLKE